MQTNNAANRVFLDIDGVMNDWQFHVMQMMGADCDHFDYGLWNPTWGWDILTAFNSLSGQSLTEAEFWDRVPAESWYTAPLSQEAIDIIDAAIDAVGPREVYFLTSPTRCPQSAAGKMIWVQNHFPFMSRRLIIGSAKHVVAQPHHLLVDDADHNCDKWVENGGNAVLLPRPWNSGHGMNVRDAINDIAFELAA